MINDIEINELFEYYGVYGSDGIFYLEKGGGYRGGVFKIKGLVDFKYELLQKSEN